MSSVGNIIKLNIGGTIFQTSKSTLTRFDGFFKTMIETDVPIVKDDSGSIFIDRSAKHFDSILNFMRDGRMELPESSKDVKEIRNEAEYYLLTDLMDLCNVELKNQDLKRNPFQVDENFKILHNDNELLQLIGSYREKPVLIIYYENDRYGQTTLPDGFYCDQFISKYKDKLDIYFKSQNAPKSQDTIMSTVWTWSFHYHGEHSYHSPSIYGSFGGIRRMNNDEPFLPQLEKSIQEFLTFYIIQM